MKTRTFVSILILVFAVLIISSCATTPKTERQKRDISDSRFLQAIYNGNPARIKKLIEAGANVNARTIDGKTALMYTASFGRREIMWLLIEAGADVNIQGKDGNTALLYALSAGYLLSTELLIEAGAVVYVRNDDGDKAHVVVMSCLNGYTEVIEFLFEVGADLSHFNWSRFDRVIVFATNTGQTEIVKLLTERGALVATDQYGRTVLIITFHKRQTEERQTEIINLLIKLLSQADAIE
jgi:ankyrin repeat protein